MSQILKRFMIELLKMALTTINLQFNMAEFWFVKNYSEISRFQRVNCWIKKIKRRGAAEGFVDKLTTIKISMIQLVTIDQSN